MGNMEANMGKTMKFKPILLIVPFLCALCVLFLVDQLYLTPLAQATAAQRQQSGQSATGGTGTTGTADGAPLVLSLAIGRTGSLQEGGGEPIYKTSDGKGKPVAVLQYNCAVLVKEDATTPDWVCVDLPGDEYNGVGYVKASAVERKQLTVGSTDPTRDEIVKNAVGYIGLRFVRFGDSLKTGLDCSNFIRRIYALSGISIPDTPNAQRDAGLLVQEAEAQPGDLIHYPVNEGYGHVAMYLGDGMMINCSGAAGKHYPQGGVRICRLQYKGRESYEMYDLLSS